MQRPVPNEDLLRRSFAVLEAEETSMQTYLREEHSAAIGGARVAMDALRRIWPIEVDQLPPTRVSPAPASGEKLPETLRRAHQLIEDAYRALDRVGEYFHGSLVQRALLGEDVTRELEEAEERLKIGPKHAPPAPPVDDSSAV